MKTAFTEHQSIERLEKEGRKEGTKEKMAPKISPDTTTHVEEDTSSPISQPSPSVSVMNANKSSLVSSTSESSAMKNQSEEDRHYQKTEPMEWLGVLVWPCMLFLPLLLSSPFSFTSYKKVFPSEWYIYDYESGETPKREYIMVRSVHSRVILSCVFFLSALFIYLFIYSYIFTDKFIYLLNKTCVCNIYYLEQHWV